MDSLEYLRSALLVATNRIYDIIVADVTTEYSKNDTVYLISSISLLEDNGSATISRYEKSSLNTNLYLHLGSCFYLLYNPKEKTN